MTREGGAEVPTRGGGEAANGVLDAVLATFHLSVLTMEY